MYFCIVTVMYKSRIKAHINYRESCAIIYHCKYLGLNSQPVSDNMWDIIEEEVVKLDIIECIKSKRSIRNYEERPISNEDINQLIELGTMASTGSGMEPWAFLVIKNREEIENWSEKIKTHIRENIEIFPYMQQYESWLTNPKFSVFNNAGTLLVIYGNTASHWYVYDCTLAAGNIMLAAHSKGIGTCWIGFAEYMFNTDEFKKQYGVPLDYNVVCPLSMGYTKGTAKPPVRKPPIIFE